MSKRPQPDSFYLALFHRKYRVDPNTGCWLWQAGKNQDGYGRFAVRRKVKKAHRWGWHLIKGAIPPGLQVCHNCPGGDNRLCVNPDHMFLGTPQENFDDRKKKWDDRGGYVGSCAKLTWQDVDEIRFLRENGIPVSWMAKHYGVSASNIEHVIYHRSWKKVNKGVPNVKSP